MNSFKFPRSLKLKSEKSIKELFDKGSSLSKSPLRVFYNINATDNSSGPKVAFTVSKKNFKRAVDRNLLKRKMRESFRLNKEIIFNKSSGIPVGLQLMFLYTSREIHTYKSIETSMIFLISSLKSRIENPKGN